MTISTIKTTPIRHMTVTADGIELDQFSLISSSRAKQQVYQALCFGGVQSLLARSVQYAKLQTLLARMKSEGRNTEADVLEQSTRFLQAKELAYTQAKRLATIHSVAETDEPIVLEFTPTMQRGSSQADLAKKAEFSGMQVAQIQAIESKNAVKRLTEANEAAGLAEALFYSVDIHEPSTELNAEGDEVLFADRMEVYIHPEAILKALNRTRDWLIGWSQPDYAELGLLKADIEMLEEAVEKHEAKQQASSAVDGEIQPEVIDGTTHYKQHSLIGDKITAQQAE